MIKTYIYKQQIIMVYFIKFSTEIIRLCKKLTNIKNKMKIKLQSLSVNEVHSN